MSGFSMQHVLEHFGVAVAAITGVLAARGKKVDLFGVIVLALVTAFGGGSLRDVLLGEVPVFWIRDSDFLITASVVALMVFVVARFREVPETVLLVADAFALALFTTIGAKKALAFGVTPSIAVAMGVITGVVGGIIRDVLTGEIPLVFRREIYLYATASLSGAVVLVLLDRWLPQLQLSMLLASATTLILRLAAIRWKLGLPVFHHRSGKPR